jgi:hypothetical protein
MSFITGKVKSDNVNPSANSFNSIVVAVGSDTTNLIRYSTDGGITWTATGNKTASNELLNMSNLQGIATNVSTDTIMRITIPTVGIDDNYNFINLREMRTLTNGDILRLYVFTTITNVTMSGNNQRDAISLSVTYFGE